MKASPIGLLAIAVAVTGVVAVGIHTWSTPSAIAEKAAAAAPGSQEPFKATEYKAVHLATTGAAPREPRIIPITREAEKMGVFVAPTKPSEISAAQKKKKIEARERAGQLQAERKARRYAARQERRRARDDQGYQAYGQGMNAFSYR